MFTYINRCCYNSLNELKQLLFLVKFIFYTFNFYRLLLILFLLIIFCFSFNLYFTPTFDLFCVLILLHSFFGLISIFSDYIFNNFIRNILSCFLLILLFKICIFFVLHS